MTFHGPFVRSVSAKWSDLWGTLENLFPYTISTLQQLYKKERTQV